MPTHKYDVYICCVSEDEEIALKLYEDIKANGLKPWLKKKDSLAGKNEQNEIKGAIKNSRYFLPLISRHSVSDRGLVQRELKTAIDLFDEFPISDIYIIPAQIDETPSPYKQIQDLNHADFRELYETGLKKLLRTLKPGLHASEIIFTSLPDGKDRQEIKQKQTHAHILKKVSEEIGQILMNNRLKPFKEILIEKLIKFEPDVYQNEKNTENALVAITLLRAIFILKQAVKQCIDNMRQKQVKPSDVRELWAKAVEILGRIVLLSVDYERLHQIANSQEKMWLELDIPIITDAGQEIIFSSYMGFTAKLTTNPTKTKVYGRDRITPNIPESGWETADIIQTIKKDLWKKFNKAAVDELPDFIDENETEELNARIEFRNMEKQNIYIPVPRDDKNNSLSNIDVLLTLKRELPALHTIIFPRKQNKESSTYFILTEKSLEGYLKEFFQIKPE